MDERLNLPRFLAAGAVTGLLVNIFGGILYAGLLAAEPTARPSLAQPSMAGMAVFAGMAFVMGFVAIWLYVGVRARLGPGPITALKVGLAVWFFAYLVPSLANVIQGQSTPRMYWVGIAFTVAAIPLATGAGAWLYTDPEGRKPPYTLPH
jgi:hypothetical protein